MAKTPVRGKVTGKALGKSTPKKSPARGTAKKAVSKGPKNVKGVRDKAPKNKVATRGAKVQPKASVKGSRMSGLDLGVYKTATGLLARRASLLGLIRDEGLSAGFSLRLARLIEVELRARMPKTVNDKLGDLVWEAREKGVLTEEGFHLATRIRHVRNGIAHDEVPAATLGARNLMVAGAAILLWLEFES